MMSAMSTTMSTTMNTTMSTTTAAGGTLGLPDLLERLGTDGLVAVEVGDIEQAVSRAMAGGTYIDPDAVETVLAEVLDICDGAREDVRRLRHLIAVLQQALAAAEAQAVRAEAWERATSQAFEIVKRHRAWGHAPSDVALAARLLGLSDEERIRAEDECATESDVKWDARLFARTYAELRATDDPDVQRVADAWARARSDREGDGLSAAQPDRG